MPNSARFNIEVNFLTGRYVATCHNDRLRGEWPPHPARLFSALVAAWADVDEPDQTEHSALEWLESRDPPAIAASSAITRTVATHFVPVNDTAIVNSALQKRKADRVRILTEDIRKEVIESQGEVTRNLLRLQQRLDTERDVQQQVTDIGNKPPASAEMILPNRRGKQERHFPSVTPNEARVTYLWQEAAPKSIHKALDQLLQRVTRLGHPASLVACRATHSAPKASWVPGKGSEHFRSVQSGQLAELERRYAIHRGISPRALPYRDVSYETVGELIAEEQFMEPNTVGDWIVFEFSHDSRAFPSTRIVEVATAMRGAILRHAEDPMPASLSGHEHGGAPSRAPHLAFLPLPYVGSEYADGRLLGIALSVPRTLSEGVRQTLYQAIGKWEKRTSAASYPLKLTFGQKGVLRMARLRSPAVLAALRAQIWQRPSRRWVSATPIALPKHPGHLSKGSAASRAEAWHRAEAIIAAACEHVGLPEPTTVEVSVSPYLAGVRSAHRFPAFVQSGPSGKPFRRQLVHASVTFENPVAGPLMLGAGRFFGLGLMRPMPPLNRDSGEVDE